MQQPAVQRTGSLQSLSPRSVHTCTRARRRAPRPVEHRDRHEGLGVGLDPTGVVAVVGEDPVGRLRRRARRAATRTGRAGRRDRARRRRRGRAARRRGAARGDGHRCRGQTNIDGRAPVIQPTSWSLSVSAVGHVGDLAAAVEHHDPVADVHRQRQVVGDQHDRDALLGHPPDQRLHLLGLLVAERRGRLVEQQHAVALTGDPGRAAGERDDLALPAGEHLDRPGHGRGAHAERVELGLGPLALGLVVDEPEPAERALAQDLAADVEVGRDVLGVDQREVLVDHLDPGRRWRRSASGRRSRRRAPGSCRRSGRCAPDITLSRVDLPAPLSPSSADDLALADVEVDRVEGADEAVVHVDARCSSSAGRRRRSSRSPRPGVDGCLGGGHQPVGHGGRDPLLEAERRRAAGQPVTPVPQ